MFTVELYAKIRRAVMIEGLSRREAATRFGGHRNTISKMLSFYLLPRRFRNAPQAFIINDSRYINDSSYVKLNLAIELIACSEPACQPARALCGEPLRHR
jgi:hypothetical protein